MDMTEDEVIKYFNGVVEYCETFCFITRDNELQSDSIAKLSELNNLCLALKQQAIANNHEDFANVLLGFECVSRGLAAELEMWILLKQGRPDDAWDKLIEAQMAVVDSVRAHGSFAHNTAKVSNLEDIKRLIFPPQVFVSAGLTVGRQECSICGAEYGECEHLIGKPYWGELCHVIARDIQADHVAMVEHPADKRCRGTAFYTENGQRNRMTWKIEPREFEQDPVFEQQKSGEGARKEVRVIIKLMHRDLIERRRK